MVETGKLVQLVPDDRRLGCMMHLRRRFYEAFKLGDKRAAPAVDYIRRIYEVEAEAKKLGLDADGRLALRKEKSLPSLEGLFAWIVDIDGRVALVLEADAPAEHRAAFEAMGADVMTAGGIR